jgi:phosphohistidine phosphatase
VPFRLDLLRHGDAVLAGSGGDAARALSAIGRRDVARMAEEFARQGWRPQRVFVSPLRRAQETARILVTRAIPEIEPETMPELDPSYGGTEVIAALCRGATVEHVLAIGHQPLLGQLATVLTGDSSIRFPPAGMVWLEFPGKIAPEEGRLVRSVLPERLDPLEG